MAITTYSFTQFFNETTVNTTYDGSQSRPDIARLANGDIVVTWQSDESAVSTFQNVLGQRINSDWSFNGVEFNIQSGGSDVESHAKVEALPNGGFVVAYQDTSQNPGTINTGGSGGGTDVNIRAWTEDYSSSTPFNPNAHIDNQTAPAIAANSAGQYAVILLDPISGSVSDNQLRLHLFNEGETTPFVSTTLVDSPGTSNIVQPSLTALNNDTFVATWVQDDDPGTGTDWNVYHQRFNTGGVLGGPVLTNAETDDQAFPVVTGLADGGYVIVWMDEFNSSVTDTEIQFHIYNADGTSRNYGSVYSPSGVRVDEIAVSSISDGAFIVTFTEETATEEQVKAQVMSNEGARWGDVFTIEDQTALFNADANQSSVVGLGGGSFFTVWRDFHPTGDTSGSHIAMQGNSIVRRTEADVNETVHGDDLRDLMIGNSGNETLYGDGNDDQLEGNAGHDNLFGGTGNDILIGGAGVDNYHGGSGSDTVVFLGAAGWNIDLVSGTAVTASGGTTELLTSIENITGSDGNDTVRGTSGANSFYGNGGDDVLIGGGGVDDFYGGAGTDTADLSGSTSRWNIFLTEQEAEIISASGNTFYADFESIETVIGPSNQLFLYGTDGNETVHAGAFSDVFYTSGGVDTFHAGLGRDTISFGDYGEGLTIRGSAGFAELGDGTQVTTFSGVENLWASSDNDDITGTSGNNGIYGRAGDDTIHGGSGDDTIWGQAGRDLITGGRGDDRIDGGGDPNDYAFFSGNQSQYNISTSGAVTTVEWIGPGTGDGTDTLTNIEFLGFDDGFVYL